MVLVEANLSTNSYSINELCSTRLECTLWRVAPVTLVIVARNTTADNINASMAVSKFYLSSLCSSLSRAPYRTGTVKEKLCQKYIRAAPDKVEPKIARSRKGCALKPTCKKLNWQGKARVQRRSQPEHCAPSHQFEDAITCSSLPCSKIIVKLDEH